MSAGDPSVMIDDNDSDETFVPYSSHLMELSKAELRRVRALKKHQLEIIDLESKLNQRIQEVSKEFESLFENAYNKRKLIVTGEYEPKDEECNVPIVHGISNNELKSIEEKASDKAASKGVSEFWLHAMSNTWMIGAIIQEHDAPILKHLVDVTCQTHVNPNGFTLSFHFEPNPYFANTVLTKQYEIKVTPDEEEPFEYDGPIVSKSKGVAINWYEGKDVTKLEDKDRETGKTIPAESFFKFFDEKVKELTADADIVEEDDITDDFSMGVFIRDELIPKAVLFYTGEKNDNDDIDSDDFTDDNSTEDGVQEIMEE